MGSSQESTAMALSVALQHPTVSSDPKNICNLLQTCKSWRAGVQQSSAGLTDVKLLCDFRKVAQPLQAMSSLSAWLPKCLGLVRRIEVSTTRSVGLESEPAAVLAAVEALLACSINHQPLQDFSTAGAAMVAQFRPTLQLQQYSSNVLTGLRVISALPVAALTSLCLSELESSSALTALSRLTALKHLDLDTSSAEVAPPNISMLQRLTDLIMTGFNASCGLAQLPVQLQQLAVSNAEGNFVADLQYLQQLLVLRFEVEDAATETWVLPAQLQQLTILCFDRYSEPLLECYHVSRLKQLTQLKLNGSADSGAQLLFAAQMPQLQHLSMKYFSRGCLRNGAAQAWCRIPQLRKLRIDLTSDINRDDFWQLVRHVAAISQLRKLRLDFSIVGQVPGAQEAMDEGLCKILSSMTLLQDLQLKVRNLPGLESSAQDVLHLTALKGLTRLRLCELQLDAAVATCLAVELTNLQWLKLLTPQLDWCVASLPAINKLTRLTYLHCSNFSDAQARRGLSFLTGLTSLTALKGFDNAGEAAITEFWAALKHQRH